MYKFLIIALILMFVSCCKSDDSSEDRYYLKCKIDNKSWKSKSTSSAIPSYYLSIVTENDTIRAIYIEGFITKDNDTFLQNETLSLMFPINLAIQDFQTPIMYNFNNANASYINGFLTNEQISSYPTVGDINKILNYRTQNVTVVFESLTRYDDCINNSKDENPNGNCFELTGKFEFTGINAFQEYKTITDGEFKLKDQI